MSTRSRSPSVFRPAKGVDQSALEENEALVADINRRNVLRGALSLGALSFLTGCDVSDSSAVRSMLLAVSAWNDRVQEFMFRPNHLAPTFSEAQVRKPPRFNAYYPLEDVRPVDATSWRLELAGHIAASARGALCNSTSCHSRSSSCVISVSRAGTTSASGRA